VVSILGRPSKAVSDLQQLHRTYIVVINQAVALDRVELVRELADAFIDDAHRMLTGAAPTGSHALRVSSDSGPRSKLDVISRLRRATRVVRAATSRGSNRAAVHWLPGLQRWADAARDSA
jgi:hypothetical protein